MHLFRPDFGKAELAQGLTSILNGSCGLSIAPVCGSQADALLQYLKPVVGDLPEGLDVRSFAAYQNHLAAHPLPLNVGTLVGMGTLRACVAGFDDRELTAEEYRQLHHLLETSLASGAVAVSLGLGYAPECF